MPPTLQQYLPFTVLKQQKKRFCTEALYKYVATVPTVYGIETTINYSNIILFVTSKLQQYLPFTVLKQARIWSMILTHPCFCLLLQQYLPFTVLKLIDNDVESVPQHLQRCNSTYRLRY